MADKPTPEQFDKLETLIKDVDTCMLVTNDDNMLRSRPMRPVSRLGEDGDRKLYFYTNKNAPKVDEVKDDSDVNLAFACPEKDVYVSISGHTHVSHDRAKIKELWSVAMKAWFPDGPEDESIALLIVDPVAAEYWDAPNSTMIHLYGVVKATLTGESPNPGGNAKVDL